MGYLCSTTKKPNKIIKSGIIEINPVFSASNITKNSFISIKKNHTKTFSINRSNTRKSDISSIPSIPKVCKTIFFNKTDGSPYDYYDVISQIGEGSYGKVYLVKKKGTTIERAMKEIKRDSSKKETQTKLINNPDTNLNDNIILKTEIEVLQKIDHPNIIKIFEYYTTIDRFFIISEYFKYNNLLEKIQKNTVFSEEQAAFILFQIFSAVNYLHFNKIIHRDIKPENILITRIEDSLYYLKLIDFGSAKDIIKKKKDKKLIGSTYYIAPEVFGNVYTKKCDIWSVGVIFYMLMTGEAPFNAEKEEDIIIQIKLGNYNMEGERWNQISKEAKDLLKQLLEVDYKKRINAKKAIKHNYFKKNISKNLLLKNINKINDDKIRKFCNNINKFKPTHLIQYCALLNIIHHFFLIDQDLTYLQEIFYLFDKKNYGCLRAEEIKEGFNNLLKKDVFIYPEFFSFMDCNKRGYVNFKEFAISCIDKERLLTDDMIKLSFSCFDINSTGKVTIKEMQKIYGNKDLNDNLHEILNEINHDECFVYEEYKNLVLRLL